MRSFRNRTVQEVIQGTRTSPHTAQVITSTGNRSLDTVLGGGLPLGSIFLCEEDHYVSHSKKLVKYFLAEGVTCDHYIYLGSLDDMPRVTLCRLPTAIMKFGSGEEAPEEPEAPLAENGLRIAWRYNDLPFAKSETTATEIGHDFNFLETINPDRFYTPPVVWDGCKTEVYQSDNQPSNDTNNSISTDNESIEDTQIFHNPHYGHLIQHIQKYLRNKSLVPGLFKNMCRVCLTSLGSPLWYGDHFGEDLLKFLTILMACIRSCDSVCFITMPMRLIAKYDATLVPKIRQLVDYAIELETIPSEQANDSLYKEYSGLIHLHKMTALNTLAVHMPETTDLAYKVHRKKLVIEKLHLPPELQETSSSTNTSGVGAGAGAGAGGDSLLGCNRALASLDF